LLRTPRMRFVMGNHDAWFAFGLPSPRPEWMSEGESAHQLWTHAQLDPVLRSAVGRWPYAIDDEFEGVRLRFVHYALDETERGFQWLGPSPGVQALDAAFGDGADLVCFGHDHAPLDVTGRARYFNPGALGCSAEPAARFAILEIDAGRFTVSPRAVAYDDSELLREFVRRRVPERDFILTNFFGRG
jgi:hypothetical protein